MIKKETFEIINFIRVLIIDLDKYLENFPKRDLELKQRLNSISYSLLENAYDANQTSDKVKKVELVTNCIAKVKCLDFMLNICYEKKIINNKRYIRFGDDIDRIIRYLIGWNNRIKG